MSSTLTDAAVSRYARRYLADLETWHQVHEHHKEQEGTALLVADILGDAPVDHSDAAVKARRAATRARAAAEFAQTLADVTAIEGLVAFVKLGLSGRVGIDG